jgi:hypothetical protein
MLKVQDGFMLGLMIVRIHYRLMLLVFKGPVHRTEKKTETGLNRTD